jgi:hypothetical protein
VVSIPNKRDRYEALANRFAELSGGSENVTAVVVGRREQAQLTGLVREALQNAGQLGRDGVEIEARQPVWLDSKTRRMPVHTVPVWCLKIALTQKSVSRM